MIVLTMMGLAAQINAAQVYLAVPGSPYSDNVSSWKVWAWADGQGGHWVSGTELSGKGVIEFTLNDNDDNLLFAGVNSNFNNSWNDVVKQSVNLQAVADGTYTFTGTDNGQLTADVTNPTYNTVYLDPSAVTESGNVWYAWSFASGGTGSWVAGTQSSDGYTFNVTDIKDQIIFVRMNANGAPSWNNGVMLNQTNDLSVRVGGTYVITSLGTNRMEGYWESQGSAEGKPIWHQDAGEDPNYYLSNRRALVGRHCMVNKLINVVGVGSWINNLNNLVDEDLENYATFPKIADVGVGVNPVTSVRDTRNHYAAGTTAGFNIVLAADASLLDVDLANCFAISFYLEGQLQQTVAVSNGQAFGGVGLSLITLPGSTDVSLDVAAIAPCEFDEIALMPAGVQVSVASTARLRYAFVGDLIKHTITYSSMDDYAAEHGRMPFTLDQGDKQHEGGSNLGWEDGYWAGSDLINDDLTDGVVWGVIGVGSSMEARVGAAMNRQDPDQSQPFKAGSTVGFVYGNGSILNLPIGDAIRIRLYEGHWVQKSSLVYGTYYVYEQTEVQDESVKINVLSVNLIKGGNYEVTIKANHDFSHARLSFPTGLTLNLGGNKVKYAYICDAPEFEHHCNLGLSADVALCSTDTQYQLTNDSIPVTWSLVEQPAGANASVDQNGLLTGITVEGEYRVRATAADGCFDEVIVTSGLQMSMCDQPISNGDSTVYALSEELPGADGALIVINDQLINEQNVLNANYNDYATYNSVLNAGVIDNLPIVGVKKLNGNFSDGQNKRRVGFVVETKSTGLSVDALNIFNIRCYKNGVRTYWHAIDETNVVKAKVIGSDRMQKMRYSIKVPADVEFDEFALWISGTLSVNLEKFKIYYAFEEEIWDNDTLSACGDPLGCEGFVVSNEGNNATLNSDEIQFAGAINVANVVDNLSWLVDNDLNTGVSVTNTISAGTGLVFAIDLGHVYSPKHQVGIVIDNKTYLAEVNAGNWLTIKTYLNGVETGDQQSDWGVLGVNAIGYGDKSYLYLTPTHPYDEVRITVAAIADLLDFDTKYFGLFIRGDYDGDGTPDCRDDDNCPEFIAAGADIAYESEFAAADEENNYKNHVIILNNNDKPITATTLANGTTMAVYRYNKDQQAEGLVGTVVVTNKTVNADGTAQFNYTFTPGISQSEAGVKTTDGQFGTDEWGVVDFDMLHVTDIFSASTQQNNHSDKYYYKLITSLGAETDTTDFMLVPVLKTKHKVNAATFTVEEVEADTTHTLEFAPVDDYVLMQNAENISKYESLRVDQAIDTVAQATREDENTFEVLSKNEAGVMRYWNTVTFADTTVQTVVLRDSTMQQPLSWYVPVINAYTPSLVDCERTDVESTYGADRLTDQLPALTMTVTVVEKSKPYYGDMSYTADITLTSTVPSDMRPYLYRIWRVMPDSTEVLLNKLQTLSGGSEEDSSAWHSNYEPLKVYYPGQSITIRDIFADKAITEQHPTESVNYIARLYAEGDLPTLSMMRGNRDGNGYAIAPASGSGEWDDDTQTALHELNSNVVPVKTIYYNPQGMSSSKPFDGVNIIVIQYSNGATEVQKHVY